MTRIVTISCAILCLGLITAIVFIIGCSENGVAPEPEPVVEAVPDVLNDLKYNEVCFKEVHNSYQRHVPFETALSWVPSKPYKYGAGCVEIDLRIDPGKYVDGKWDWSIAHVKYDPDPRERFANYLKRLKRWSVAHPGHRVVTVQIDAKDGPGEFLFSQDPAAYTDNLAIELDNYITAHFDTDLLFKPSDIIGGHADLVAGIQATGWPTLGELTGKFIFVFGISFGDSKLYSDVNPAERLCFAMARYRDEDSFDTGNRIFFQWDIRTVATVDGVPWPEKAMWLRSHYPYFILRGQNICQDANEDGDPDCGKHMLDFTELNDGMELWAMARSARINMISTDLVDEEKWATVGTMPLWPIEKRTWGDEEELAFSGTKPAAVEFEGKIHVLYNKGSSNPLPIPAGQICMFTGDFLGWGDYTELGFSSVGCPALAVYQNELWMVYPKLTGSIPVNIVLQARSYDSSQWSEPVEVSSHVSGNAGMAVYDDKLYVVYPDAGGQINYTHYDGTIWADSKPARGSTNDAPAVCVFNGKMYVVYSSDNSNVYLTSFDGSAWAAPLCLTDINGSMTNDAPAIVRAWDGRDRMLVVLRSPGGDGRMYRFSILESGHISGLEIFFQGETSDGVALTGYGSTTCMLYQNGGSNGGRYYALWM